MKARNSGLVVATILVGGFASGYLLTHWGTRAEPTQREPEDSTPASVNPELAVDRATAEEARRREVVRQVMAQLRSQNPAVRESGRTALAQLPAPCRELLKNEAAQMPDDAIRALVWARIVGIDEMLALDPPKASLHVKDASLPEIVSRLADQTGPTMAGNPSSTDALYTLDAEGVPLWEVFRRLSLQHPVGLMHDRQGLPPTTIENFPWMGGPEWQQFLVQGSWVLSAQWIDMPDNKDRTKVMRLAIGLDPRLTVLELQVGYDAIYDDQHRQLMQGTVGLGDTLTTGIKVFNRQLGMGHGSGTKISSWRVQARAVVALSSEEFDIPDLEHLPSAPFAVGPVVVKITGFSKGPQLLWHVEAQSSDADVKPHHLADIFDGNGNLLARRTTAGNVDNRSMPGGGGPYRMHLLVPRKVKVLEVEFEVKDFMLPKL